MEIKVERTKEKVEVYLITWGVDENDNLVEEKTPVITIHNPDLVDLPELWEAADSFDGLVEVIYEYYTDDSEVCPPLTYEDLFGRR